MCGYSMGICSTKNRVSVTLVWLGSSEVVRCNPVATDEERNPEGATIAYERAHIDVVLSMTQIHLVLAIA
jgi:hypothetical protein